MASSSSSTSSITIHILFFASAREAVNRSSMDLELPVPATTDTVRQALAHEFPQIQNQLQDTSSLTLALNEEYVLEGQVLDLKQGDTVALIPPISGG